MIGIKVASIVLLCTIAAPRSRATDTDEFRTLVMNFQTDLFDAFKASTYVSPRDRTDEDLKEAIFFNLFTRSNPTTPQLIYLDDDKSLERSHFDHRKPTRFFVHSWQGSVNAFGGPPIRDAYLAVGDYNVIVVDWNAWAKFDYTMARSYVPIVAKYLGSFIDYLESKGASLDEMIVTGHCLGAHIAGLGARHARHEVGSVVGMNPAGPLFHNTAKSGVMSKHDAKFVEIIHTSARIGYNQVLGHADYYPNGGTTQPGCFLDVLGLCSHLRSYEIFAESIVNPDGFMARACSKYRAYEKGECDSNAQMRMGGDRLDTSARGTFYLKSRATSPFGLVHEHHSTSKDGPCDEDDKEVAAHFGIHGLKFGKRCRN